MAVKIKSDGVFGNDFYNTDDNLINSRTSDRINMIRSTPGKIRKRLGYYLYKEYPYKINGMIFLYNNIVVHAGTRLYIGDTLIYSSLFDDKSFMFVMNDKVYLLDRTNYYVIDVEKSTIKKVEDIAYVPIVKIGKNADGSGGICYEDRNVLTGKWTEQFCTQGSDKIFQLCYSGLNSATVTAKVRGADGVSFFSLTENKDFSVDRTKGIVTFLVPPQKSLVSGEDNVIITAKIDVSATNNYIKPCTLGFVFGDSSKGQRVFLTGNRAFANYDFFSGANDATYFGEYSYGILGDRDSLVMGYLSCGDKIAAIKGQRERKIYVRKPYYQNYDISAGVNSSVFGFVMCDEIEVNGKCVKNATGYGENEGLFLTNKGVFALAKNIISNNVFCKQRGYFANGKLLKEADLDSAVCVNYNDFYIVFVNGHGYAFDLLQKCKPEREAVNDWQYECFYLENIDTKLVCTGGDKLYFTADDGIIYCFYKDENVISNYLDNNSTINCSYTSGFVNFGKDEKFKQLTGFYITLGKSVKNEVYGEYYSNGVWKKFVRYRTGTGYDSVINPDNTTEIFLPVKLERAGKSAIKILNNGPASPLFIDDIGMRVIE